MKRIALLANDTPGLEVCKYLVEHGENIVRVYTHPEESGKCVQEIIEASGCSADRIYSADKLKDKEHVGELKADGIDWIITVYWAYLLSEDVISCAQEGTVNFHPALLPINRGWFPHVHSIIDGSPCGVTIHAIDKNADTGPIWAQKQIALRPDDTADTIYYRLQSEIVSLFKENWPLISKGEIQPSPQSAERAVYHKKSEINELDELNLDAVMKVGDVLNILRARSFGQRGFAYFIKDGVKYHVNVRLGQDSNFQD